MHEDIAFNGQDQNHPYSSCGSTTHQAFEVAFEQWAESILDTENSEKAVCTS
jgi:hypothetical protein